MNVLECYIEEIYEERELTPEEWAEWKAYTTINPDDVIFVHWKYNFLFTFCVCMPFSYAFSIFIYIKTKIVIRFCN